MIMFSSPILVAEMTEYHFFISVAKQKYSHIYVSFNFPLKFFTLFITEGYSTCHSVCVEVRGQYCEVNALSQFKFGLLVVVVVLEIDSSLIQCRWRLLVHFLAAQTQIITQKLY